MKIFDIFKALNKPIGEPLKRKVDLGQIKGGLITRGTLGDDKKQSRPLILNATTLKRLSNTDPVTWAIKKTRKDQISQVDWKIVRSTDKVEQELDQWQDTLFDNLNEWGYTAEFKPELIKKELYQNVLSDIDTAIKGIGTKEDKKARIKWLFQSIVRRVRAEADRHTHSVKYIFEKPNTDQTSWQALMNLIIDDILVFDAGIIVKNNDVKGNLAELYTIPGEQIFLYRNEDRTVPKPPEPAYVWESATQKIAEFTTDELLYIMDNPQQWFYGMCVVGDTMVETDKGKKRIWQIVKEKQKVKVKTYNFKTKTFEFRPIINWFSRKVKKPCIRIEYGKGGKNWMIRATDEHPVMTKEGWRKAVDLTLHDRIMVKTPIVSKEQLQIILGTLLGDAGMGPKRCKSKLFKGDRGYSFPSFGFGHCSQQKDYFDWKVGSLSNFSPHVWKSKQKSPHSENLNLFFSARISQLPILDPIFKLCYEKSGHAGYFKKKVTNKWLNKLSKLGLAVWFMDDGSISRKRGKVLNATLCTDNFSIDECNLMIKWFKKKWNIKSHLYYSNKKPRLGFKCVEAKKLLHLIKDYLKPNLEKLHRGSGISKGTKIWIAKKIIKKGEKEGLKSVCINSISREQKIEDVFDIEVEETHNFVVNNAIVHNSPLEVAAYVITASLWVDSYNIQAFKEANVPPGLLNLGKDITRNDRKAFQAAWNAEITGQGGMHRLMFVSGAGDEFKFVPLKSQSSKDMEMIKYLEWTLNIKSACFQISPQDIGYVQNLHRTTSEIQYQITKDRGLRNLLQLIQHYVNSEIMTTFGFDDIKFDYLGKDAIDPVMEAQKDTYDLSSGVISRNDRRKKLDMRPIEGGDIIMVPGPMGQMIPIEQLSRLEEQLPSVGEQEKESEAPLEGEGEKEEKELKVEVPRGKSEKQTKSIISDLLKNLKDEGFGDNLVRLNVVPQEQKEYEITKSRRLRPDEIDRWVTMGGRRVPIPKKGVRIAAGPKRKGKRTPFTSGILEGMPVQEYIGTKDLLSKDPSKRARAMGITIAMVGVSLGGAAARYAGAYLFHKFRIRSLAPVAAKILRRSASKKGFNVSQKMLTSFSKPMTEAGKKVFI